MVHFQISLYPIVRTVRVVKQAAQPYAGTSVGINTGARCPRHITRCVVATIELVNKHRHVFPKSGFVPYCVIRLGELERDLNIVRCGWAMIEYVRINSVLFASYGLLAMIGGYVCGFIVTILLVINPDVRAHP